MSDLFRSALNYISTGTSGGGGQENEFVGQIIELGPLRLTIRRLIAEGGFAFIFLATDQKGIEYALKRLLAADKDANKAIISEINFLKQLSGHPNIVTCIHAASLGKDQYNQGRNEYLLLTEFCKNGPLVDILRSLTEPLTLEQITKIFYQTCRAVLHMHSQKPPVIHCDLKIENLLFDSKWNIKLCDFGSATCETYSPDHEWTALKRRQVEEELASRTTPMYRAPEMLELYQNLPINEMLDIWALGCILYYLCYLQHPFEDSAKLRIINAKYTIPANDTRCSVFHDLIFGMLQPDPKNRPNIREVCERLEEIAAAMNINLNESIKFSSTLSGSQNLSQPSSGGQYSESSNSPSPSRHASSSGGQSGGGGGGLLGSLKGQAGFLFKNIKDTSAKVVQSVQSNKYGIGLSYPSTAQHPPSNDNDVARRGSKDRESSPSTNRRYPPSPSNDPSSNNRASSFNVKAQEQNERTSSRPAAANQSHIQPPAQISQVRHSREEPEDSPPLISTDAEDNNRRPPSVHRSTDSTRNIPPTISETSVAPPVVEEADLLNLGDFSAPPPPAPPRTTSLHQSTNSDFIYGDLLGGGASACSTRVDPIEWSSVSPASASVAPTLESSAGHCSTSKSDKSSSSYREHKTSQSQDDLLFDMGGDGSVPSATGSAADTTGDLLQDWNAQNIMTAAAGGGCGQPNLIPPPQQASGGGLHRNVSAPNFATHEQQHSRSSNTANAADSHKFEDPFADLTRFTIGGGGSTSGHSGTQPRANQSVNNAYPQMARPDHTHLTGEAQPPHLKPQAGSFSGFANSGSTSAGATQSPQRSAPFSGSTNFSKPNYGRTNFDSNPWSANKPKIDQNAFDDLLSSQSFPVGGASRGPQTLSAMKREIENKELDANAIKIRDWIEGKQRNVRALLCSLHTVLWEENDKWEECSMGQLLTPAQVKKYYRKACLAVHPDKLTGTEHEILAKLIFTELNDAWNEFAKSEQLPMA